MNFIFLHYQEASNKHNLSQNLMAHLDMMERKEEATRLVRAGLKKRLEAKIDLVRNQEVSSSKQNRERTGEHVIKPPIGKRFVKLPATRPIQQPRKRP